MSSPSLPQGANPGVNLTTQGIGVSSEKNVPTPQIESSKVHQAGDSGETTKTVGPKVTVEMIPKVTDIPVQIQPNLQEAGSVVSTLPISKHSSIPVTVAAKKAPETMTAPQAGNSGAALPPHIGQGGLLQPQLITNTTKIAGIAAAQVTRGSHITAVRPGPSVAATTIMRSNLPTHAALQGSETVLSPVYMYPPHVPPTGASQIQAKLLAPPAAMSGTLRVQGPPPAQSSSATDHNRNLGGSRKGQKRGPYHTGTPLSTSGNLSSKSRGQPVLAADSKLPLAASPHVQPITFQLKTDGTHHNPYPSQGVPQPTGLKQEVSAVIPSGLLANHQQTPQGQSSNQKQDSAPPMKVEVRMVICSDQQDKVKNETFRVDQVIGRLDPKDSRVDMRGDMKDGKTGQIDPGSKATVDAAKLEHMDSPQNVKDIRISESKDRSGMNDSKKLDLSTKGEREVDLQRVYRPEMKMSLKADIRHDMLRSGEQQASWQQQQPQKQQQQSGGVLGLSSTRHTLLQPSPQKTRMTVSPSTVVPSAKPHIRTHTISSVASSGTPSSAAAILVSANSAIPVTNNLISSASIPVAKVYPQQQQTQPPPQQVQPHGANSRVITNTVRLPSSTAADTTTAPTSFQPMQPTVRGSIPLSTLQNLSTVTGQENRQHRPPHHTVISTQQPFHHAHNRLSFPQELFGYGMIQSYQSHPYHGTLQNSGIRGASDGHARFPYVTTSTSLSTVGGHSHVPPVRYPLTMMLDPMTVGLTQGVQSSADGHAGDGAHVTGSLNQVGANPTSDSPTSVPNSGASPRPSILRKRVSEGSSFRRHPVSTLNSSHLGRPESPASKVDLMRQQPTPSASPKPSFKRGLFLNKTESDSLPNSQQSAESNASETSTDTAPSSVGSVKIKPDPDGPTNEAGQNSNSNDALPIPSHIVEEGTPSPRKKQRKQDLKAATEHPDIMQDPSTDEEVETKPRVSYKSLKKYRRATKGEHMKVVHYVKRTCPRLMDAYKSTCSWKPALNHFERYTDVKPKDEKKISIHEIANQRGIIKKTEGWKIKHISGQFEDLTALEQEIHDEIEDMKRGLGSLQTMEDDVETATVYELVQGSLQRSKYVIDNLGEARTIVMKLLEHKPKVSTILKKHANKRHAKKKNTSP